MSIQINVPDHILFEDESILVVNKPASLMVEPDRNGHPNLLHQVKKYLRARATNTSMVYVQHVHRLDRPVSGIVLFVKQREVLRNLSEQFAQRLVKKYYYALTECAPALRQGFLEHWHRKENKRALLFQEQLPETTKVTLGYDVEPISNNRYRWAIELHSGKFHQIRAQLSVIGCPIIGDVLYGSHAAYKPDSIALHASKLIFTHPITNQEITIEAPVIFDSVLS